MSENYSAWNKLIDCKHFPIRTTSSYNYLKMTFPFPLFLFHARHTTTEGKITSLFLQKESLNLRRKGKERAEFSGALWLNIRSDL